MALEASKRSSEHDDASLRQVLHESRRRHEADDRSLQSALDQSRLEHEDAELEAALRISMQQEGPKTSGVLKASDKYLVKIYYDSTSQKKKKWTFYQFFFRFGFGGFEFWHFFSFDKIWNYVP